MKKQFVFLLAVFFAKVVLAGEPVKVDGLVSVNEKYTAGFTENKGQVYGYDGLPYPEVNFEFVNGNTQVFLLKKGMAYQFTKIHYPNGYLNLMKGKHRAAADREKTLELAKKIRTETFRMDMVLTGANAAARVTTEGTSTDLTNYYNRGVMDVHSYNKITYHGIYPGIDWVIYTNEGKIKYDFVVSPGADPSMIKMEFKHQEGLTLNKDGSFKIRNSLGSITEKKPVSFQDGKKVETNFILSGNTISFELSHYDRGQPLTIDPAVLWATYYGATGYDNGFSCTTDGSGNIYMAGVTESMSNIASGGHQNTHGGGNQDAFLVKFNSGGVRQWGTYYGGSARDEGFSCATDASGNVYLAGNTISTVNIASGGHQNTYAGGYLTWGDGYLVKFNSSGVRQWATYYGGSSLEDVFSCATDGSGNVYLAGATSSTNNIGSGGFQNTYIGSGGAADAFLVKFNTSGVRQWATYYGGTDTDWGRSCSTDGSGNVYLCGYTSSTAGIASGGHQNTFGGGTNTDGFLAKFNSAGARQWATYYGGAEDDDAGNSAADGSGNIYLAGSTTSTNNIASGGHQNTYGGGPYDVFLVKFNGSGVRQWGTYYGDADDDEAGTCAVDGSGNVFLTGGSSSSVNIAFNGYQNTFGGGDFDAMLIKFNGSGTRLWATYYGGSDLDAGLNCAVDANGNIYLAGITGSTNNIASGGHQNNNVGNDEAAFLVKFFECTGPAQPGPVSGKNSICAGEGQTYSVNAVPNATGYLWTLPNGWTGTSTNNVINLVPGSTGTLSVSATNTCSAGPVSSLVVTVSACTSLNEKLPGTDNKIQFYPNPFSDAFTIEGTADAELVICNATGQIILRKNINQGQNQISMTGYASGIYFLVLNEGGYVRMKKIVKE